MKNSSPSISFIFSFFPFKHASKLILETQQKLDE